MPTPLPTNPFTSGSPLGATTLNTIHATLAAATQSHSHDPSDAGNGYGGGIPAWGPQNVLYTAHGPGSPGSDWKSAYNNTAAIPADPAETAISPTGTISASDGIAAELQRVRGQFKVVTGAAWNAAVSLVHLSPGTPDSGNVSVAGTVAGTQLVSTVADGTAPLAVTSSTTVAGFSSDLVDGYHASDQPGTSGYLLATDSNGLFPLDALEYDAVEAATNDVVAAGSTLDNSLNRMRYVLLQIALASGGTTWQDQPTSLVTSLAATGNSASGGAWQISPGAGIAVTQDGSIITLSATGSGPDAAGGLTYADLYTDAVVSGLTVSAGSGLVVDIAPGIAYVGGGRQVLLYQAEETVPANSTQYLWWSGVSFTLTPTNTNPGGWLVLAEVISDADSITTVTDLRTYLSAQR